MPIKSFKGQLADRQQRTIRLGTNKGQIGYKIRKFQMFPAQFGVQDQESTIALWRYKQEEDADQQLIGTSALDFDDHNLLAAACMSTDNSENNPLNSNVIFDHVTINQDIFITHIDAHADNTAVNYYVELEQVKLSLDESAVATLKDMRGNS